MYCLIPKLTDVPEGEWFCPRCKPTVTPARRKRSAQDSDDEEAAAQPEEGQKTYAAPQVR